MITATAGIPFAAIATGDPGLVGTLRVGVFGLAGTPVIAPRTTGITETSAGVYRTELTLPSTGLFVVRWEAPDGTTEEPVQVTALALTPAAVRARLPATVDLAAVGYPEGDPDPLLVPVARATRMFELITGLDTDQLATKDVPLAHSAIDGLTTLAAFEGSPDRLETVADFDLIQSFSAGSYNEQRREIPAGPPARRITAWPWLNDILWLLMTPDKRDEWKAFLDPTKEPTPPAYSVTEVDWMGGW